MDAKALRKLVDQLMDEVAQLREENEQLQEENKGLKGEIELFTFVGRPEVDATNNQAKRELRPAVITRKISGGNKTERGARSWQILKSIECTLDRQERDFLSYLEKTLSLSGTPPPLRPN